MIERGYAFRLGVGAVVLAFGGAIVLGVTAEVVSAQCAAQPSGMIGWWPGDGAPTDVLNGRNATLHNGATYGTGLVGQAFLFDGTNDDASVADAPALDVGTGDFTVDFWVNLAAAGGEEVMVEKWDEGSNSGWTISNRGGLYYAGTNSSIQTSAQIPVGTWTHIALRRSSGTAALFLNGNEVGSAGGSDNFDTTVPLLFGRRRGGQGFFWNGRIDEVHYVVGTAVSNAQIQAIYNAGSDGVCGAALCGDTAVDPGEECDDGNGTNGDGCDNNCTFTACGNSITAGSEACDDGNAVPGDGCENDCTLSCGNGVTTGSEQCDDGNTTDDDGCDHNCTPTGCQNGVVTAGEECDDGNAIDGDGCSASCLFEPCGDNNLDPGEECDDGNHVDGDGCTAACTIQICSNGTLEPGEECDDGNVANGDGCTSECIFEGCNLTGTWSADDLIAGLRVRLIEDGSGAVSGGYVTPPDLDTVSPLLGVRVGTAFNLSVPFALAATLVDCDTLHFTSPLVFTSTRLSATLCGDGTVDFGEQCDDGNFSNADACDSNCRLPACGNGLIDQGEECDDTNAVNGDACDTNCTTPRCGNAALDPSEQCDDGNQADGDDCSASCTLPSCPNNVIDPGEECDDGNQIDGDSCARNCLLPRCGNAIQEGVETCDDGNAAECDGCSATCGVETDTDGDGVADACDSCPNDFNPSQSDRDNNGLGDACDAPLEAPTAPGAQVTVDLDLSSGNDLAPNPINVADTRRRRILGADGQRHEGRLPATRECR